MDYKVDEMLQNRAKNRQFKDIFERYLREKKHKGGVIKSLLEAV